MLGAKMKLRTLLEYVTNERNIRIAAWLYLITYSYGDTGIEYEKWKNDDRMGIKIEDALKELFKLKLIFNDKDKYNFGNVIKADIPKSKKYLKNIFDVPKSNDKFNTSFNSFEKYNTSEYNISRIPAEIADHEYSDYVITKQNNEQLIELGKFADWLQIHQRSTYARIPRSLIKFFKDRDNLKDTTKFEYILYRGIHIDANEAEQFNLQNIKVGDEVIDNELSWTLSEETADHFAQGAQGSGDRIHRTPNDKCIVLQHIFDIKDVFADLYYISKTSNLGHLIDFPSEYEVIVEPKKRKYKVYKVIE